MDSAIEHFEPRFDDSAIKDAIQRLTQTRFPDAETVKTGSKACHSAYCQELVRYWREEYDWQRVPRCSISTTTSSLKLKESRSISSISGVPTPKRNRY